ncbi:ABC transporter ATP-binding protein [Flavobacterium sp.]|uniref:ABC transporter ATP-binding protein n=1 Tax=Flavobacterium sp. TaxID=239 RepID=UPI0026109042|nr:ABC transporter ATP-binding protein [Flavobacterium sp.]
MQKIKAILAKNFESFAYFYRYLRYRIFISITLSIVVGFLDGLGLSMFLPLFQVLDPSAPKTENALTGPVAFLPKLLDYFSINFDIYSVLVILCVFFCLKGVAQYIRTSYQVVLQQSFIKQIRLTLIACLNKIGYKYFVGSDVGRIQNTLSAEVDRVARAYQTYFTALQFSVFVLVYMGFAFFVDFKFALVVSVGGLLTNLIYKKLYAKTKGASRELTLSNHLFQSLIIQRVANFKYLKATGSDERFSKKLINTTIDIEKDNRKIGILSSILTATREPLLIFVVVLVIFIQVAVLKGGLSTIIVSLIFFYKALNALMFVQTQTNLFLAVSGSLNNMSEFTDELQSNEEKDGTIVTTGINTGIRFENVSFAYNNERIILGNINLTFPKNQTIALVGESGSGKTTLVNLLVGLIQPTSGKILLDELSLSEINKHAFQQKVGYITQDPVIFNDTIFNNVTFWDPPTEQNKERFYRALEQSSAADFVASLPGKENEMLGNAGINLSGGQKQRLSIARELYKDINLLVLDEATSALDSETEQNIQKNIDALKGKYTVVIIAHRLSTVRSADIVCFLKNGKIEATGSFEELTNTNADFQRMVKMQEI